MNYDTGLFIDIIESTGIIPLRSGFKDGVHVKFYQGLNGKLVMIDTTDDDMPDEIGKGYLDQLGLGHLKSSLFPPEAVIPPKAIVEEESPE